MEPVDQSKPLLENQAQPEAGSSVQPSADKPSKNWVTFDEVKAAVSHANIDVFATTAEKVQDVLLELFEHKGSAATVLKHLGTLRKSAAPAISGEAAPIPMPKELQTALHASHMAQWDVAVNFARVTYLHKVEKQNVELEQARRNEEALVNERDAEANRADELSNVLDEERQKFGRDLAAIDASVAKLNDQMKAEDQQNSAIIAARKKEQDDAIKMLEASNNENARIKEQAELQIKNAHYEADLVVKPLKEMIKDAGMRESDLRIQLHEANNRAEAAMKRADEYSKQFTDLLSKTTPKPPAQN